MPYEEEDTCVTIDLLYGYIMRRGYMPYEEEDTCVTIDLRYGYMSYEERIHAI